LERCGTTETLRETLREIRAESFGRPSDRGTGWPRRRPGSGRRAQDGSGAPREAGAEIVRELNDTDYGSREYVCRDLEPNLWSFGTCDPLT
jgi:hypothetical protein